MDSEDYFSKMERLMSHPYCWPQSAFHECWSNLTVLRRYYHFCRRSVEAYGGMCERALMSGVSAEDSAIASRTKSKLLSDAMTARDTAEFDYATLHRLFVFHLWGDLENACLNFVGEWIKRDPVLLAQRCWPDVKEFVPESDHRLSHEECVERARKFERAALHKRGRKFGLDRLDAVLDIVGVNNGSVPESLPKSKLLELHLLRDLYAHRRGRASDEFCSNFPNFQGNLGSPVLVSSDMMECYFDAGLQCSEQLRLRVVQSFGIDKMDPPPIDLETA